MRIIAGTHRGRRIDTPPGRGTRPMLDRVREAIFSSLGARLDEACVLDLYSGSGSLGLEALSRGASFVRFVESAPQVIRILRGNLALLRIDEGEAEVRRGRALDRAGWSAPRDEISETPAAPDAEPGPWADLVLMDPPYPCWKDGEERERLLSAIDALAQGVLRPDGMLVLHAPKRGVEREEFSGELVVDERRYGTSSIWYLAPGVASAE